MNGKHSGCMMWAGSDFEYKGKKCTHTVVFKTGWDYEVKVDRALAWFTDKSAPANLVMLYFDEPDEHSHEYGPESPQVSSLVSLFNHHLLQLLFLTRSRNS